MPKSSYLKLAAVFCLLTLMALVLLGRILDIGLNNSCVEPTFYPEIHNVQLSNNSNKLYDIELAKTNAQQTAGLSDRACIPKNAALVFLYPIDDKWGIWAKNMKFSIDVIWLDKDKKIVDITLDLRPDSYPKIYYPASDSRYVVELNSGQANELGLAKTQQLNW